MSVARVKIDDITDFVICYLNNEDITVTPLSLQKILYYIQAWHLVFFDDPLFDDEPEAWVNGPVYRHIYDRFKNEWYKGETLRICDIAEVEENLDESLKGMGLSKDQTTFLFEVLQTYGTMPAKKLVYLTHAEQPWQQAREGYGPFDICNRVITHKSMFIYYRKRLDDAQKV